MTAVSMATVHDVTGMTTEPALVPRQNSMCVGGEHKDKLSDQQAGDPALQRTSITCTIN